MAELIATNNITVIVGLGVTGLSVARYLAGQNQPFVMVDTRAVPPLLAEFKAAFPQHTCVCGPLDEALLCSAHLIVLGPGLSQALPEIKAAQAAGAEVIGDIELFARAARAPIVAITGSNGKTTVTTLVGKMASAAGKTVLVGGNIGTPALDLLAEPDPDFYVLELSSFQLETTQKLNALVAVVLNVTQDHMDRYPNFGAYHAAKMRIFFGVKVMLVNRDAPLSRGLVAQDTKEISFGLSPPDLNDFGLLKNDEGLYLTKGLSPLLSADKIFMRGRHNLSNALAAMALVDVMGGLNENALQALSEFAGVPHRCQTVAQKRGITFINDSKATNVGATLAALNGLSVELAAGQNIYLILGGQGKGADFGDLRQGLSPAVKTALVIGEDTAAITAAIEKCISVEPMPNLEQAVQYAYQHATRGDLVLLSPACASFDMFSGFESRGDAFIAAVEGLAA